MRAKTEDAILRGVVSKCYLGVNMSGVLCRLVAERWWVGEHAGSSFLLRWRLGVFTFTEPGRS